MLHRRLLLLTIALPVLLCSLVAPLEATSRWSKTCPIGGVAYSLVAASDGGYAFEGQGIWLIKTDEFGVVLEFQSSLLILAVPLLAVTLFFRKKVPKTR